MQQTNNDVYTSSRKELIDSTDEERSPLIDRSVNSLRTPSQRRLNSLTTEAEIDARQSKRRSIKYYTDEYGKAAPLEYVPKEIREEVKKARELLKPPSSPPES